MFDNDPTINFPFLTIDSLLIILHPSLNHQPAIKLTSLTSTILNLNVHHNHYQLTFLRDGNLLTINYSNHFWGFLMVKSQLLHPPADFQSPGWATWRLSVRPARPSTLAMSMASERGMGRHHQGTTTRAPQRGHHNGAPWLMDARAGLKRVGLG